MCLWGQAFQDFPRVWKVKSPTYDFFEVNLGPIGCNLGIITHPLVAMCLKLSKSFHCSWMSNHITMMHGPLSLRWTIAVEVDQRWERKKEEAILTFYNPKPCFTEKQWYHVALFIRAVWLTPLRNYLLSLRSPTHRLNLLRKKII